jgi:protein-S-isoprenylcysteine O-methyltransferase Ste14
MLEIVGFTVITVGFLYVSRYALKNIGSHGFYRFFAFEGILLLLLLNHSYWFVEPFSFLQIVSWTLLLISLYFIFNSLHLLKEQGGYQNREMTPENFTFENTTNLVEEGLYRYIRHPMYSSLLFLAWGAFLKHLSLWTMFLVCFITLFLYWTARVEERENMDFFGDKYDAYMRRTKIFIPWIV